MFFVGCSVWLQGHKVAHLFNEIFHIYIFKHFKFFVVLNMKYTDVIVIPLYLILDSERYMLKKGITDFASLPAAVNYF